MSDELDPGSRVEVGKQLFLELKNQQNHNWDRKDASDKET